ncbi:hypothetical protein PHYSODRAFT_509036 [Phytophthora sojae]|uniref:SWIM-type domain-containing protein n=1 Tax=Phytophthora sojae (strain P6497) TaxID=1094619 RepID=G4Z6M2_PHYSP|nr:hypothetical protein PHYSODRAFT_491267 [Phytophthora sojae]XP_009528283.1 hypothetical protein PHYSODRAFT_509036 [Phytophthora sojae]EGZ14534.1 hypothetical protein PHYSODRAFT_509036 [Phytophthora sojae]EGZ19592.1 hypothetical protein PHYSODRAFT_491267 [Phytophthora sojae]|eukprot:XP_009522309.1 hypothetical protein PHYSODRAFT_491267 [Phytophthora sojae]
MVRDTLRCTCKSYMHSGWVCSHVIASLKLLKKLDLELATEVIQARRSPGRPRAPVGARQQEPASTNFWDPDRLEALLTKEPYTPLQWAFITQVDVQKEGQASTFREDRIGTVGGVRLSEEDGVFEWSVAFVHGDVQYYQVDDLVPGLIRAHEQRNI